eukprot:jgi/Chrpa1/23461/Chrysochromulina_OHIO_Genome00023091-RA
MPASASGLPASARLSVSSRPASVRRMQPSARSSSLRLSACVSRRRGMRRMRRPCTRARWSTGLHSSRRSEMRAEIARHTSGSTRRADRARRCQRRRRGRRRWRRWRRRRVGSRSMHACSAWRCMKRRSRVARCGRAPPPRARSSCRRLPSCAAPTASACTTSALAAAALG